MRPSKKGRRDTRELIVDEAERLIGEGGYDFLRLRDIADALGIRVPSIYAHFASREAVVTAVADRYMASFARQFAYDGMADPADSLREGIDRLIRDWASNRCYLRLKLRDLEIGAPELDLASGGTAEENQEFGPLAPMFDRLEHMLERGVQAGVFIKVEKAEIIHVLFGTALLALTYPGRRFLDGVATEEELDGVVAEVTQATFRFLRAD